VLDAQAVGSRVVVRSIVRGELAPSGRPLLTDVIGMLETWADGRLGVRRSNGELVEIATADVVAGKVVPPAPAPRRPRRG
jgi:hypothetical protein